MSNMTLNCLQSLWNLSFLKPGDLRKTSLNHPASPEHSFKIHLNQVQYETDSPKLTSSTRLQTNSQEAKKELDTPVRVEKEKGTITEKDFRIMQILRSGKNFRIYMVRKENDDRVFAMKLIGKKKIVKNSITDQVAMEKEILEKAKHPFIPKLDWYFENDKKVFFVMEFVEGGACLDLILKQLSRFSEEITRFYCAEVLTILEYLHSDLKVTYNDLKLRNLLLDPQGHIKLIGYGLAKRIQSDQQQSPNASPVSRLTSSEEIDDFWGFGCLLYELLTGRKPFSTTESDGSDTEVVSPTSNLYWPCPVSKNAKDLITRLLSRDLENRMKLEEIKQHAFFAQVNWEKIMHKSIYPPLIPSQFKHAEKDQEEYDDADADNRIKYLQVPSLEKIIEDTSSQFNSDDGFTAMSYDRKSRLNSILGYH